MDLNKILNLNENYEAFTKGSNYLVFNLYNSMWASAYYDETIDYYEIVLQDLKRIGRYNESIILKELVELYEEVIEVFNKISQSNKYISKLLLTPEMTKAFNTVIKTTLVNTIPQIKDFENEVFIYIITIRKCLLELSGIVFDDKVITPFGIITATPEVLVEKDLNFTHTAFSSRDAFPILMESIKYTQTASYVCLYKQLNVKSSVYCIQEFLFKICCSYNDILAHMVKHQMSFTVEDIVKLIEIYRGIDTDINKLKNLQDIPPIVKKNYKNFNGS